MRSQEDGDLSRSKTLGSQTKKPQLAKSTFNLKKEPQQTLPQKINYSGYGLNPNRRQRSASTADPNNGKNGQRKKTAQAEQEPENPSEAYNGKVDVNHIQKIPKRVPYKSVTHRKHWGQYNGTIVAPTGTFNVLQKSTSQTKINPSGKKLTSEPIVLKDVKETIETPAIQEEIVENIEADEEPPIVEELPTEIG